ncbi:MAG: CpsD/CapB family tyrosine-protein kinase [Candidatus Brocadiia bacterium]
MPEEGKFSRAMDKAGAGGELSPDAPRSEQEAPTPADSETAGIQRVTGHAGTPEDSVVMHVDRGAEAATQFRSLRARLLALNNGQPPRVLTISSATREEGKTTVALNLAVALGEVAEDRVVVVDGDLAAPGLHLVANVEADTGLNDVLENDLELDGNVYETVMPGVDIIPARPVAPEHSSDGLLVRRCGDLLRKLAGHYAYVLVDTPPVIAASHAAIFGKSSEGVLLVARLEQTPREAVKRAAEELSGSGAQVLGCALTHRQHHVPDFIYRFFGIPPSYYYGYSRRKYGKARPNGKGGRG